MENKLKEGDKVLFAEQILTLDYYDSWFNKWEFKEVSISPIDYQKYAPPVKFEEINK